MKSFASISFLFVIPTVLASVVPSHPQIPGQYDGLATKTHTHVAHATGTATGHHSISPSESALIKELIKSVYGAQSDGKGIELEITVDKTGKQKVHIEKYHQEEGLYKQHNGTHAAHTVKGPKGLPTKLPSKVHSAVHHTKSSHAMKVPSLLKSVWDAGSKTHSTKVFADVHVAGGSKAHSTGSKTHSSKSPANTGGVVA